jgi:tetratricopeptide (TPR) repeat protein
VTPAGLCSGAEDDLGSDLAGARREYDRAAAEQVFAAAREQGPPTLLARAALLVAELARIEFEQLPEDAREQRRELGRRIDAAARTGIKALDRVDKTADDFRVEADLLATMIRSDFRARKFLDRLQWAAGRALELDPDNASAWVTKAKPLVFADPDQGRDLDEAERLLDHALELQPDLESALLLRAHAHDLAGDGVAARADWQRAVEANPDCRPARHRLDRSGAAQ